MVVRVSLLAFLALAPVGAAQMFYLPIPLDPATHSSPSGAYEFHVDPTDRWGAGEADCSLSHAGEWVWTRRLPFALREFAVTDAGEVVGYGYAEGPVASDSGDFVVAIVDPTGTIRGEHRVPRTASSFFHAPPNPNPVELLFDPESDRFEIRITDGDLNRDIETLWSFSISTGERRKDVRPSQPWEPAADAWRSLVAVRTLPGTDLRIREWLQTSFRWFDTGATFELIDGDGKIVWRLERPRDYCEPTTDDVDRDLVKRIREHGAIVHVGVGRRFTLWFPSESAQVEFEAREDAAAETGWSVVESAGAPDANPAVGEPTAVLSPPIHLEELEPVTLRRGTQTPSPFVALVNWDFASNGDFDTIDRGVDGGFTFRRIDRAGRVVAERKLHVLDAKDATFECWDRVDDREWLVAVRTEKPARTTVRRVDVETGEFEPVDRGVDLTWDEIAPQVRALASTKHRGFVALLNFRHRYTSRESFVGFDADRRRCFAVDEHSDSESRLYSPADIAIASSGDVIVLEHTSQKLKVFGDDGVFRRAIDLEAALGRRLHYPSRIRAGGEDDLLIVDFNGSSPLLRLDADGTLRASLVPRTDVAPLDSMSILRSRLAPDGVVWTTDGRCFLAFGDDGSVVDAAGAIPDPDVLDQPLLARIAADGGIYVLDGRTRAIHGFRPTGERRFVARPTVDDAIEVEENAEIVCDRAGGFFVRRRGDRAARNAEYVRFDADGSRAGRGSFAAELLSIESPTRYWTAARFPDGGLRRIDSDGNCERSIDRYPDRRWLCDVSSGAVDPDGVLVAATADALIFVSGDNEKDVTSAALPGPRFAPPVLAATREWVALAGGRFEGQIPVVHRRADGACFAWKPPDIPGSKWTLGFSADGRELLALESPALIVHRFRLPTD